MKTNDRTFQSITTSKDKIKAGNAVMNAGVHTVRVNFFDKALGVIPNSFHKTFFLFFLEEIWHMYRTSLHVGFCMPVKLANYMHIHKVFKTILKWRLSSYQYWVTGTEAARPCSYK